MIVLTLEQITKNYGVKPLMDHVDLTIETGDRIGVIGVNGKMCIRDRLDSVQSVETQAGPVLGILAVDVADTSSQHGDAQISDHLALVGISHFASTDHAVLFAADGANLGLNGHALGLSNGNQFLGLLRCV